MVWLFCKVVSLIYMTFLSFSVYMWVSESEKKKIIIKKISASKVTCRQRSPSCFSLKRYLWIFHLGFPSNISMNKMCPRNALFQEEPGKICCIGHKSGFYWTDAQMLKDNLSPWVPVRSIYIPCYSLSRILSTNLIFRGIRCFSPSYHFMCWMTGLWGRSKQPFPPPQTCFLLVSISFSS